MSISPEEAQQPLVLALDVGTSSVRAVVFDRQGRDLSGWTARRPARIRTGADGSSEVDADDILATLFSCIDEVLGRMEATGLPVAGVGICTFVSNVAGLDARGLPITPVYTYADARAAPDAVDLDRELDASEVHRRTGCRFHPSYLPARFRWLQRTRPDLAGLVKKWMSIGELLEDRLFGECAVSHSVASWTGLLDRHDLSWDRALLAGLPVEEDQLSRPAGYDELRRGVSEPFASRWPMLSGVPWFRAVGDGAAANLGCGCTHPGRVAITVGTSSAVRVVVPGSPASLAPGLWCYRVDDQRSLLGGALSEGGNVYSWLRATLQLGDVPGLDDALATREPAAHGLTILPFLTGERSPGWAGHARAAIDGLTQATEPEDIVQAALEAVAYRIAQVFDLLLSSLPEKVEIVASGGALMASPAWSQTIADALGRPVVASGVEEASARGAALMVLESLGAIADVADAPDWPGQTFEPDEKRHRLHREAMERQLALYTRLVATKL